MPHCWLRRFWRQRTLLCSNVFRRGEQRAWKKCATRASIRNLQSEFPQKMNVPSTILPGGLVSSLGGGQLGRMTAMAARTMGYRVRVMDPEPACPASFVVDETVVGPWDDVRAAERLSRGHGA